MCSFRCVKSKKIIIHTALKAMFHKVSVFTAISLAAYPQVSSEQQWAHWSEQLVFPRGFVRVIPSTRRNATESNLGETILSRRMLRFSGGSSATLRRLIITTQIGFWVKHQSGLAWSHSQTSMRDPTWLQRRSGDCYLRFPDSPVMGGTLQIKM